MTYLLMEVKRETNCVRHHIQKVIPYFSAMRGMSRYGDRACRFDTL